MQLNSTSKMSGAAEPITLGNLRLTGLRRAIGALCVAACCAACTGIPDGVEAVTDFQLERYLGTWYEIARLDHTFERGLTRVTAEYARRSDGGISVTNRGYDGALGEWREARGKAYFLGNPATGSLKVSFFGPFYGGYHVIALDSEGYQWAMVAGPSRSYLWVLARDAVVPDETFNRLVARAAELGFPTENLIFVDHSGANAH
jgi:apolipoprotein D and lipocalin family protein